VRRPSEGVARREFLRRACGTFPWLVLLTTRRAAAETPTEALAELERRTREYQSALTRLVALEEEAVRRAMADAERLRVLLADGLVARRDLETAELTVTAARDRLDGARRELAESGRILVEAQALGRLAALPPPASPGEERSTPEVAEYRGAGAWSLGRVASLERFFAERFGRPLPVSALGQTSTHDRLGFDHRNAVDVALHPDSVEGRALLDHLRGLNVPFLAFRGPLPGVSTGAHVHVGTPSPRVG
jgi:hypothetical protein